MANKDYYEILGVSKNAGKDEIKKAFHKLAMKHHPDKNNGDDTEFKKINEAYQVLSDDTKRAQYDQFGSAGPNMGGAGFGGQGGFGGFDFSGFQNGNVEFDMGDIGDIFGQFFGGGMGKSSRSKVKKGDDIEIEVLLSFEDAFNGVEKSFTIPRYVVCDTCEGTRTKTGTKTKKCTTCNGNGYINEMKRTILGSFQSSRECENCFGTGTIPEEKCTECKGRGIKHVNKPVNVTIPKGVESGSTLRVSGFGNAIVGGKSGDLFIYVSVAPHKVWKRERDNLVASLEVPLSDTLLGAKKKIHAIDGILEFDIPERTKDGTLIKIPKRGMHVGNHRGDAVVKIVTTFPSKLSSKAKKLLEELKQEGF